MPSFFKVFGGGKKKEELTTPQDIIQQLRETEEMLTKKSGFLENKIQTEITTAKRHGTKNKRAATAALNRKKRYEMQLRQNDGTLSTIKFQREALKNVDTNDMNVNQVHDLMDQVAKQIKIANEISEAILNPVGFGHDMDEAELEAELEELEHEELDKQQLPATKDQLPSVPVSDSAAASSRGRVSASPKEASRPTPTTSSSLEADDHKQPVTTSSRRPKVNDDYKPTTTSTRTRNKQEHKAADDNKQPATTSSRRPKGTDDHKQPATTSSRRPKRTNDHKPTTTSTRTKNKQEHKAVDDKQSATKKSLEADADYYRQPRGNPEANAKRSRSANAPPAMPLTLKRKRRTIEWKMIMIMM
ncbi:putative Charged multivesicular body protein 4b [Hypsibius exemplaris]|uniref:Charged multivesicular body protein 4b n=1 Tax=Hypsibius exemplaris TaxID=2072580 RepID=A0A1W0X973_HYPEX|nr:putative Charged multivesicular body protein 4b [Hypsibius exemplaris]